MPLATADLVEKFGRAVLSGDAALFIGAGLSRSAGLPDWASLIDPMRARCNIPVLEDLPLVAEYIANDAANGGLPALHAHILADITGRRPKPAVGHRLLSRLPVREIWTTNYDRLLEDVMPSAAVAFNERTIREIASDERTLIKMHGSISTSGTWEELPVITRTDYERYEPDHPRTWTILRASYLSRRFLFLGFSFADPNVEVLLRLARTLGTAADDQHIAVMPRTDPAHDPLTARKEQLHIADLENSGVQVCEIQDFDEVTEILTLILRRTRPEQLFISGSSQLTNPTPKEEEEAIGTWCAALASTMVDDTDWALASLGGAAGWLVSRDIGRARRAEGTYDPAKLSFHYRDKEEPPTVPDERIGTAVYSDLDRERLVVSLLDESRALVVIRGGDRTKDELEWAQTRDVGIVPLAASGGTAHAYWLDHRVNPPPLGGRPVDMDAWARLDDARPVIAARAARDLLRQAMYQR